MTQMTSNAPDATQAPGALTADEAAEIDAVYLRDCDFLQFWRDCAEPGCRRARSCTRDPDACFFNRWDRMSDIARFWAQAGINAIDHGASRRAAAQFADRRLLHHLREREGLPRYMPRRRLWRRV